MCVKLVTLRGRLRYCMMWSRQNKIVSEFLVFFGEAKTKPAGVFVRATVLVTKYCFFRGCTLKIVFVIAAAGAVAAARAFTFITIIVIFLVSRHHFRVFFFVSCSSFFIRTIIIVFQLTFGGILDNPWSQ